VQHYGSEVLDSSLLRMPAVGFAQAFTHLSRIDAVLALAHSPNNEAHLRAEAVSAGPTRAGG
jgi:hypothetical protein